MCQMKPCFVVPPYPINSVSFGIGLVGEVALLPGTLVEPLLIILTGLAGTKVENDGLEGVKSGRPPWFDAVSSNMVCNAAT